jgi:Rad3-related DNA helicase
LTASRGLRRRRAAEHGFEQIRAEAGTAAARRGRGAKSFTSGGTLIAEAGTGTGKTLAYLVPAILARRKS